MNTASPILIQSTREMTFSLFDEANKNREKNRMFAACYIAGYAFLTISHGLRVLSASSLVKKLP